MRISDWSSDVCYSDLGPVTIRVNAANLKSATLAGAGSLQIDKLEGQRAMVGLRGPGRVAVGEIAADRLQVAMIGNGTMTLGGTVKTARMTPSGAGALAAGALAVAHLISDRPGATGSTPWRERAWHERENTGGARTQTTPT